MPVKTDSRENPTDRLRPGESLHFSTRKWAAPRTWYALGKDFLEFVTALLMAVVALPVILLLAVLVKLTSRGPAFYSQTRLGKDGRPYQLHKLRTMFHECEKLSGPRWSTPGDPRVTWIGGLLRKSHLDELPQLWNVLKGEMSLVGPRPERPEFVSQLKHVVPFYMDRLLVKPGVTGLAQIQLPPDTDVQSVRLKVAYDLYYVQNASLWLDVRIIFLTAFYAAGSKVFWPFQLLGMPKPEAIEKDYEDRISDWPPPASTVGSMLLPTPSHAENGSPLTGPHMMVDIAPGV